MPLDRPLDPQTRAAIEAIARTLRELPCANSHVAMALHQAARELEAVIATVPVAPVVEHAPPAPQRQPED